MKEPTEKDWMNVKRILRYLQSTKTMKIIYSNHSNDQQITGYCDASYAEDRKDRKSTSGYLFMKANGPISWKSKKQPIVSLSSMEAEYIALTSAAQEALWLKKLNKELEMEQIMIIYEDNQSTIKTSKDEIHNQRSKHIDVRYHFIREMIKQKEIEVTYLPTDQMLADILTKPLGSNKVNQLTNGMGLKQ